MLRHDIPCKAKLWASYVLRDDVPADNITELVEIRSFWSKHTRRCGGHELAPVGAGSSSASKLAYRRQVDQRLTQRPLGPELALTERSTGADHGGDPGLERVLVEADVNLDRWRKDAPPRPRARAPTASR